MLICFFLVFEAGAAVGSMIRCAVTRSLRNETFLSGRSRCLSCGTKLKPPDLVPVFSWIALRGRCRYCGAAAGTGMVLTEAVSGAAALAALLCCGGTARLLFCWYAGTVLLLLSLTDLFTMRIPDMCHVLLAGGWAVLSLAEGRTASFFVRRLAAALLLAAVLLFLSRAAEKACGRAVIGGGDIRLLAVFMLWFGGRIFLLECMLGSAGGILTCLLMRRRVIPFGPALSAAAYFLLLLGSNPAFMVFWA